MRNGILTETASRSNLPPIEPGSLSTQRELGTWGVRVLQLPRSLPQEAVPAAVIWEALDTLFRSQAHFYVLLNFVPSPWGVSRTFGSRSATHAAEAEEPWVMKNRRRVYLIDKKYRDGLSPSEAVELRQLQEDVSRQMNTVAPLPEKPLEALEALARRLEQGDAQQDG